MELYHHMYENLDLFKPGLGNLFRDPQDETFMRSCRVESDNANHTMIMVLNFLFNKVNKYI